MCMVLAIANIRDNSFENKVRIEQALKIALAGMAEVNKDGTGMAFSTHGTAIRSMSLARLP